MSRGSTLVSLSPRSWILDGEHRLSRPEYCDQALGVGRGGSDRIVAIALQGAGDAGREMYEVFATGAYAIVDGTAQITTLDGFMPVGEVFRRVMLGEELYVEEYHGDVVPPAWSDAWLRAAPHASYFPEGLLPAALQRMPRDGAPEVSMPRPLFAQTWWMMRHLARERKVPLGLSVDNKTFPAEIKLAPRTDPRCKVTAMTKFHESAPLTLRAEGSPWHLVCDGLIIH
jgi:hypothetical protein